MNLFLREYFLCFACSHLRVVLNSIVRTIYSNIQFNISKRAPIIMAQMNSIIQYLADL